MEKNYENMIEERANHLYEIMAQHVSDEELTLIKEAVKLVRKAFEANYSQNGEPYCIEILDYATYYATKSSPNTNYVVASILYPLNVYWEKVSNPVECNLDLNIKIIDLIYEGIEADRRMRSAENWSEPIYMPTLHAVPEYPLTKDELISRGDPAPSDSIKTNTKPGEELTEDLQDAPTVEIVIEAVGEDVMSIMETEEEDVMLIMETEEEDVMPIIETEEEDVMLRRREPEKENYELYERLMNDEYYHGPEYEWPSGEPYESMGRVKQLVNGYWKTRYLIDFGRKVAFEVLDGNMCWKYFSVDDIDWNSMKDLGRTPTDTARQLSARYPSFIYKFEDGVALVEWQLCPDGMYWMDEDGYGMTPDDEISIYGVIDKNMNVLVKFRYIGSDIKQLKEMKEQAKRILSRSTERNTGASETKVTTETKTTIKVEVEDEKKDDMEKVAPKGLGKLDMVIAFDTTGSMAAYIEDVRQQVADMIPRLFKDNEDLRLGIVAFGDYCDMTDRNTFGQAYQCMPLTDNENDIIKFVKESKDTSGGDGDEFYELVIKKIVEESPWREDSSKAILLIADATPHRIGYTYRDYVVGNQIDWRIEANKAADMKIKIDTVSIRGEEWYKELSYITNGISVPFKSSGKTGAMIETATTARSAMAFEESARKSKDDFVRKYCMSRSKGLKTRIFDESIGDDDVEMNNVRASYFDNLDSEA